MGYNRQRRFKNNRHNRDQLSRYHHQLSLEDESQSSVQGAETGEGEEVEEELTKPKIKLAMWDFGQCDAKRCTGRKLSKDPDLDLDSSRDSEKIDTDSDINNEESTKTIEDFQYCKSIDDNCYNWKISKHRENNIAACHNDVDQNQDKILLPPKTLDCVTKDSIASVCLGGTGSVKDCGSNIVAADHPTKAQSKSQITSYIQMLNVQTPSAATVSSKKVTIRELPQNVNSIVVLPTTIHISRNQTNLTIDDVDMEAFYATLDAEISVLSLSNDTRVVSELANRMPSEETQKALKTLQDFLTKDFSVLLDPGEYSIMKSTLDYLTNLFEEDGISVEIRSLIIEVSRQFTCWSQDYTHGSKKIESTTAKLLKADEVEEGLEANKTLFREVMYLEDELCNELAYLEERKKELEEQINAVKANISTTQAARNIATHTKREIFGEANILKAQRDELRAQVPHLRYEQELAKKIQANIRAEWSNLGEKFNNSLWHKE